MKLIGAADYYPAGQGRTFNMDYYLKANIPLLKNEWRRDENHHQQPSWLMVHATFDSFEVFASAFAPHAAELQGDAPNYTNIQPVVRISEVLMG